MATALDDLPLMKDEDLVGVLDRGQAVGNRDAGCVFRGTVQRILDNLKNRKKERKTSLEKALVKCIILCLLPRLVCLNYYTTSL